MTPRFRAAALAALFTVSAGKAMAATDCSFKIKQDKMQLKDDCTTDSTIFVPNGLTLEGGGHTITAVDPAGDHFRGSVVRNAGAVANVHRLTVTVSALKDICDFGAGTFGEDRLRGISLYNASGRVWENRIVGFGQGPGSTCIEGTAILAENGPFDGTHPNTVHVTVESNEIVDVQRVGVAAQGDVAMDAHDNTIGLSGAVGAIPQSGVTMAYGATGTVTNNRITAAYQDGVAFAPQGVEVFESSDVRVARNTIRNTQDGIFVQSQCFRGPNASNNRIEANVITGTHEAILLVARAFDGTTFCNAHVDDNVVTGNTVKSGGNISPLTGILYGVQIFGGPFVPVADGNAITFNTIQGFQNPLVDFNSTNTTVTGNKIQ